jgi:hypothetical protein
MHKHTNTSSYLSGGDLLLLLPRLAAPGPFLGGERIPPAPLPLREGEPLRGERGGGDPPPLRGERCDGLPLRGDKGDNDVALRGELPRRGERLGEPPRRGERGERER